MAGTIIFGIDVESASEDTKGYVMYGRDLFYELGIQVTWFITGKSLEKYPKEFAAIEKDKFIDIQCHTYNHILLKTVFMELPAGVRVHGKDDFVLVPGATLEEIDKDLGQCDRLFNDVLGRHFCGLTGPWGYYRGLQDSPDILSILDRYRVKFVRTFARNEHDCQPVPMEWQPFFYKVQGYPDILELCLHDYQDDFYWDAFRQSDSEDTYQDHLKRVAERVAKEGLVWSQASHDHGCATREGFEKKAVWIREFVNYAKDIGIRFMSAKQFYDEVLPKREQRQQ